MGMSAKRGVGKNSGRRRNRRTGVDSEINVTPLVDVMLVLLIVFMVAAPLLSVGVPIELPKTDAKSLPCLLYTSPSPRDRQKSRMPSSA